MKELKKLVQILSKYRETRVENIYSLKTHKGKTNRFSDIIHKILTTDNFDDEAACKYLYNNPPDNAYYFFKHRLRKLSLNSLFHIDFKKTGYSDYAKAEFDCSMLRHQVYTLGAFDARNTVIDVAGEMMKIAGKYELAEYMAYDAMLLSRYAAMTGPKKLFEKYNSLYKEWAARELAENKARTCLNKLTIEFVGSAAQKPEMADVAFGYAKEIETDMAVCQTWVLQYHWYWLIGYGHYIKGEHDKSISTWKQLEDYLFEKPLFKSDTRLGIAVTQQMVSYIETRDYNNGVICAVRCLKYFKPGSTNWLIFQEYFFLLLIQNGKYNHAVAVYNMTIKDKNLPDMPESNREKWTLYHAWLYYIKLVPGLPLSNIEGDFHLYSFLNKFNYLNKDKEGYNVSLLIVDIGIRIHGGDKIELMKKMTSLKTYRERYLKKDNDYRVQAMVQLLLLCEELNYQYEAIINRSAVLFKKLQLAPLINTNSYEGLELVPYDLAWPMVLEDIKKGKLNEL